MMKAKMPDGLKKLKKRLSGIHEQKAYRVEVQLVVLCTTQMKIRKILEDLAVFKTEVSQDNIFISIHSLQRQIKIPFRNSLLRSKSDTKTSLCASSTLYRDSHKCGSLPTLVSPKGASAGFHGAKTLSCTYDDPVRRTRSKLSATEPAGYCSKSTTMIRLRSQFISMSQNTRFLFADLLSEEVMKQELIKFHFHHVTEMFNEELPLFPVSATTAALFVVDGKDPWGTTGYKALHFRDTEIEYASARPYKSILAVNSGANDMSEEDLLEFQRCAKVLKFQWAGQFNRDMEGPREFRELLAKMYRDMAGIKPPSDFNLTYMFPEDEALVKKSTRCGYRCGLRCGYWK